MTKFKNKNLALISSDTIIWEGEDLPCIKLCSGDVISDVVYKLAIEICAMKAAYNLKDLDLQTIFHACVACPQPSKTLQSVLQLIINKVKTIDEIINTLGAASAAPDEPSIALAACFLPQRSADGDLITKLPHSQYTRLIANLVCKTMISVNGTLSRLDSVESGLAALQTNISLLSNEVQVQPVCALPTNAPVNLSVAFTAMERMFCGIKEATGSKAQLTLGMSKQYPKQQGDFDLSKINKLSTGLPWDSFEWVPKGTTVGESINNLWSGMKDIYGAVKAMQDNCCKVNCDSIVIDFGVRLSDDRLSIKLFFASMSKIPVGFTDCDPAGTKLTITDSAGAVYNVPIHIAAAATYTVVGGVTQETPISIDLGSNSALDPSLDYTITLDPCMTNGAMTCQKCITKVITYKDTCAYCEITVTGTTTADASLIIIYQD